MFWSLGWWIYAVNLIIRFDLNLFLLFFSLVDLGEENETKLKMPAELEAARQAAGGKETVEAAKLVTTEMAEQAGERPTRVSNKNNKIFLNLIRKRIQSIYKCKQTSLNLNG